MRLTELTISGFKSFAKTTTFGFPAATSAIVGPNGSGKSNVAEAMRWVLGEQSMKSLRGKRGEDLIFSGSPTVARTGKASVTLSFDNRDRSIPLDFETVTLERKIFRDGMNEYYMNGSQVRLKDIVELLAQIGLGETKHNIIGQGEVDRILSASPRERRDLLEEAIGLRLWQLKKREAERRLGETDENASRVEALIKEISPHLKFLKTQAERAEKRDVLKKEIEDYYRAYVQAERSSIRELRNSIDREAEPARKNLERLEREIGQVRKNIRPADGEEKGADAPEKERELARLETGRRELERELGRVEGRLEYARQQKRGRQHIAVPEVRRVMRPILDELSAPGGSESADELRLKLRSIAERLELVLNELESGTAKDAPEDNLSSERERIQEELRLLDNELGTLREGIASGIRRAREAQSSLRENFEALRELEEEAGAIKIALQRAGFESEKLAIREDELERLIAESGFDQKTLEAEASPFAAMPPPELRKKMERLRARLEEIGGIDSAVLKEYHDTKTRHDFLERELSDLAAASKDLRSLITELEDRIERDFQTGFAKIKDEFHNYFRIIFGGGRGMLAYIPLKKASGPDENDDEEAAGEETDYGIDIEVDLPRKRIKGLAMLSGGERALVSIAMLFAITAVNPPPFLVLDETDAALDEANSQKYGAILKALSEKTQLIIITHNRETMKRAGVLYGVTMGDDGVSKILSIKLEEAEVYGNR